MINTLQQKILNHPDLEIELTRSKKGEDMYVGRSSRYEPYEAFADTAIDCFFKFNIQLAEQKIIAALLKAN
jgi:hypothetical protein